MRNVPSQTQRGYSLLELSIVVILLGMVAAIAMPTGTSGEHQKLALAGSDVADALRYAREEARRTGVIHGVAASSTNNWVRVFRLDEAADPNARIFDVYHPVSKQLYTVDLDNDRYRGVILTSVGGQLSGACTDPTSIVFDSGGVVRCFEPVTTRIGDAAIVLNLGNLERAALVDSYAGRVTVE